MMRHGLILSLLALLLITASGHYTPRSECEWVPALSEDQRPVNRSEKARNVILFTDGINFDDVVSILFLAKSRKVNLLAIYIQGNAWSSPGAAIRAIFNLLHMMGPEFLDVPIYLGSYYAIKDELVAAATGQPIKLRYRIPVPFGSSGILYSDTMHGMAPFVPQGPNVYDIRRTPDEDVKSIPAFFEFINSRPADEKHVWISLGTLTPIAKMFGDDYLTEMEAILPRVERLVVMGGALDVPGNLFTKLTNTKAEFNIYNDPHAAQWAFANLTRRGTPVTLVPLDGTDEVPLEERLLRGLRDSPRTPEAQLAGRLMENLFETWFDPDLFFQTAFLWDPTASIVAVHPRVVTARKKRYIRIVFEQGPDGPEQGWTKPCDDAEIAAGRCALVTVITGLNGGLVTDVLFNTLQSKVNSAALPLVCL